MLSLAADRFKHQCMVKYIAINSHDGNVYYNSYAFTHLHSLFLHSEPSKNVTF